MTDDRADGPGEGVGRVLGTDDATPLQFWAAVAPGTTCSSTTSWSPAASARP